QAAGMVGRKPERVETGERTVSDSETIILRRHSYRYPRNRNDGVIERLRRRGRVSDPNRKKDGYKYNPIAVDPLHGDHSENEAAGLGNDSGRWRQDQHAYPVWRSGRNGLV